ncbi:hypothetical protein, partial [Cereibacter johrii]|uniref:hypothetical protein n=1 Tax=Cereibacter johrii TaxID=445629 RepID=UPI003CE77AE0
SGWQKRRPRQLKMRRTGSLVDWRLGLFCLLCSLTLMMMKGYAGGLVVSTADRMHIGLLASAMM